MHLGFKQSVHHFLLNLNKNPSIIITNTTKDNAQTLTILIIDKRIKVAHVSETSIDRELDSNLFHNSRWEGFSHTKTVT